jgi:hypothetical protein
MNNRNRFLYFILIVITIALGLASRHISTNTNSWVKLYLGDAIWALMVFWGMGFVFARKSTLWIAIAALIFSFSIEISQLYHAEWIDFLRSTTIGGLVLGFGFLWSDLLCYSVGIGFGFLMEKLFANKMVYNK